jgi:hypothetical protein
MHIRDVRHVSITSGRRAYMAINVRFLFQRGIFKVIYIASILSTGCYSYRPLESLISIDRYYCSTCGCFGSTGVI